MLFISLKMLIKDKAKYYGIIIGLSFAGLIITQQSGIFVGLMARTYGFITDTSQCDIWVMDPKVQFIDDIKPLKSTDLLRVKSIDGIDWAVPLYKGLIKARLLNGNFQNCNVIGIDDATLIGQPPVMLKGKIEELRRPDSIIVDEVGSKTKLSETINGQKDPLQIGEILELNDHRAEVVGICRVSRTFQSQPVIYTTYSRATTFAPKERKQLSFILVKAKKNQDLDLLCKKIEKTTHLAAYTNKDFAKLTVSYFMTKTGIPINFGVTVLLGFIIGTAIAGQTFYNFTLDNLKYFGTFKAMGAFNKMLIKLILSQAIWVGTIGWALGVGSAALFGFVLRQTELSFRLPWELFLVSGFSMYLICILAAFVSFKKILKLEPMVVFKS